MKICCNGCLHIRSEDRVGAYPISVILCLCGADSDRQRKKNALTSCRTGVTIQTNQETFAFGKEEQEHTCILKNEPPGRKNDVF